MDFQPGLHGVYLIQLDGTFPKVSKTTLKPTNQLDHAGRPAQARRTSSVQANKSEVVGNMIIKTQTVAQQ